MCECVSLMVGRLRRCHRLSLDLAKNARAPAHTSRYIYAAMMRNMYKYKYNIHHITRICSYELAADSPQNTGFPSYRAPSFYTPMCTLTITNRTHCECSLPCIYKMYVSPEQSHSTHIHQTCPSFWPGDHSAEFNLKLYILK